MKGRLLILSGLLIYATVVGCVMWPGAAPAAKNQRRRIGGAAQHRATQRTAQRHALPRHGAPGAAHRWDRSVQKGNRRHRRPGRRTVEIVVDSRQENGSSRVIFLDMRMSPTPDKLLESGARMRSRRSFAWSIMPIVLLEHPRKRHEWRGTIAPNSGKTGSKAIARCSTHYAKVAEAGGADIFSSGLSWSARNRIARNGITRSRRSGRLPWPPDLFLKLGPLPLDRLLG